MVGVVRVGERLEAFSAKAEIARFEIAHQQGNPVRHVPVRDQPQGGFTQYGVLDVSQSGHGRPSKPFVRAGEPSNQSTIEPRDARLGEAPEQALDMLWL